MKAFHSFWSAPNRGRHGGAIVIPDYELLTMMLSALEWRRLNGPIRMITDSDGAAWFARAGLDGLWSETPDTALDGIDASLDPLRFWAAGKLWALRGENAPCVMLDTDMVLWENINDRLNDAVVAAHREALHPAIYPDPREAFVLAEGYAFPSEWDLSLPAANTAFLYVPNDAFKSFYVDSAFAFMRALRNDTIDPTVSMCFAEQRILPMCAAAHGMELRTLLDQNALDDQRFVTHLWGRKNVLAASPEARIEYCLGCVLRILRDFPEWEQALAANEQTRHYLQQLK